MAPLTIVTAVLLVIAASTLVNAQASDATCYWPNGTPASGTAPCGSGNTEHSTCCNQGWACLSNGLCMPAGQDPSNLAETGIIQGACTDRNWTSPDCPRWCVDAEEISNLGGPQPFNTCPGATDRFYCVNGDEHDDCDEETDIVRFPGTQTIMTTIGVAASTSSPPPTSTGGSATNTPNSITTGEVTETSGSAGGTGPDGGSGDGGSGGGGADPLAIGLGVGIGVGGLGLILAGVFFLLWRRRVRKAKAAADADGEGGDAAALAGAEKDGMSTSPDSVVTGSSELPATLSRKVAEAPPDAMVVEAPTGDPTLGRVEAPPNELRHEIETAEGIQGRHELMGSDVPPAPPMDVSPVTELSPATHVSPATVSPTTPVSIPRKTVGGGSG